MEIHLGDNGISPEDITLPGMITPLLLGSRSVSSKGFKSRLLGFIKKDSYCSYLYAFKLIHGPFPAGEEAISLDEYHSYYYAKNVLHGRFQAGEEIVSQDIELLFLYILYAIQAPFPEGER